MWAGDGKVHLDARAGPRVHAWALFVLAGLGSHMAAAAEPPAPAMAKAETLVLVVRHAEKLVAAADAAPVEDPPLTAAGEARAAALADALADARVAAIYSTPFRRTRATAAPLAARAGVEIISYAPDTPAIELAGRVLREHRGRTVLVVGHSNTVPDIVEAFSGTRVEAIEDAMYGRLYVVSVDGAGTGRLLRLGFPPGLAATAP